MKISSLYNTNGIRLWMHSFNVARLCERLSRLKTGIDKDAIYLAGLMHDVGKTVINNAMPELYIQIYEKMYKEKRTLIEIENEVLGFNHTTIGNLIAKKWKLPEKLEMIITYHHTYPYPDYEPMAFWGDSHKLDDCMGENA